VTRPGLVTCPTNAVRAGGGVTHWDTFLGRRRGRSRSLVFGLHGCTRSLWRCCSGSLHVPGRRRGRCLRRTTLNTRCCRCAPSAWGPGRRASLPLPVCGPAFVSLSPLSLAGSLVRGPSPPRPHRRRPLLECGCRRSWQTDKQANAREFQC